MTVPQFSRPGAVDLSALRRPATSTGSPGEGGEGPRGAVGRFVIDIVDEPGLREDVLERSLSYLVIASFWSADAPASVEINDTLTRLADEFDGRFVLTRIDAGTHPELAQAFGVREVPLVVAIVRGQLAPVLQDPLPEAEMRALLQQLVQAAAANGVSAVSPALSSGQGEPAADDPGSEDVAAEPQSAHPVAEAALLAGDVDTAIEEYQAALNTAPGDAEAALGLAQASLLKRAQGVDTAAARKAAADDPADIAAQTLVADIDLLEGQVDDAFARLVEVVRTTAGDDRDRVRGRLIELFSVVGDDDPRVGKARSLLASALF